MSFTAAIPAPAAILTMLLCLACSEDLRAPNTTTEVGDAADTLQEQPLALPITVPPGFDIYAAGNGVTVYNATNAHGAAVFVAVVDLRRARLRNLVGNHLGAPMAEVERRAPIEHWDHALSRASAILGRPRVLITGTFYARFDPAHIAFGVKADGTVISYGYGASEHPGQTKAFAWNEIPLNAELALYDMVTHDRRLFDGHQHALGGLAFGAHPASQDVIARASLGLADLDRNGAADTLFLLSSPAMPEPDIASTLTAFGADESMLLSGATTAFMIVDGIEVVPGGDAVPHAIAVFEPQVYREQPCDCTPAEVIIDDADPDFTTFGNGSWWTHEDAVARAGAFHYTRGTAVAHPVWTGVWRTPTPITGRYEVEAHIAELASFVPTHGERWVPCANVRYRVLHDGVPAELTRDQRRSGWISLGVFVFTARFGEVRLSGFAEPTHCGVQFDAIRFTRRD